MSDKGIPTVSIVMPVYNGERYIRQAMDSVVSQSYRDWELLVVDDCSKDSSATIVKEYVARDERVHYFRMGKASGSPAFPRNLGIQQASGRFIAFLDCDDVWLPGKLEEQVGLMEEEKVAIAYTNYEKMNEEGERNDRLIIAPAEVCYKELLKENVIGCLTAMYDTRKIGKVYFERMGHEDYVMWLSILKKGCIAKNTNSVQALYRVNNHSISSNKLKVLQWQWNIYRNKEKLSLLVSCYYFSHYAFRAGMKFLK